jgi:hypothetical protein
MDSMKGSGRVTATFTGEDRVVELLQYADASWGIRQNAKLVGIWEPDERDDCMKTFVGLTGVPDTFVVREASSTLGADQGQSLLN